jgi:hypothetical protein
VIKIGIKINRSKNNTLILYEMSTEPRRKTDTALLCRASTVGAGILFAVEQQAVVGKFTGE